jgi:hypothetical protein
MIYDIYTETIYSGAETIPALKQTIIKDDIYTSPRDDIHTSPIEIIDICPRDDIHTSPIDIIDICPRDILPEDSTLL